MTRRCFHVPELDLGAGEVFELPPRLSRQLDGVLRARAGEPVELIDCKGSAWTCVITGIRKGIVSVRPAGRLDRGDFESRLEIILGLGMARADTMDLVIRQACEMGAARITVFRARRSQYGLTGQPADKKRDRWSRIAAEAMCQCGRARPAGVEIFDSLENFVASIEAGAGGKELRIFALERGPGMGLLDLREKTGPDVEKIWAVIGPEGGWDNSESLFLTGAGFTPVSLGPRTMRLETAAVALLSSIQLLWGDLGGNRDTEG